MEVYIKNCKKIIIHYIIFFYSFQKDLKKKYCYEQILEDIKERKINNDKSVISFSDMIELDVQRTFFEENVDESRNVNIIIFH